MCGEKIEETNERNNRKFYAEIKGERCLGNGIFV
jgi:hypothetical protein